MIYQNIIVSVKYGIFSSPYSWFYNKLLPKTFDTVANDHAVAVTAWSFWEISSNLSLEPDQAEQQSPALLVETVSCIICLDCCPTSLNYDNIYLSIFSSLGRDGLHTIGTSGAQTTTYWQLFLSLIFIFFSFLFHSSLAWSFLIEGLLE